MREAALAVALLGACGGDDLPPPAGPPAVVVVSLPPDADAEALAWRPAGAVERAERLPYGRVRLTVRGGIESLALSHPAACPGSVTPDPDRETAVVLPRFIDAGQDLPQVGFDAPFRIEVEAGCDEARRGRIEWIVAEGALASFRASDDGFVLSGRTRPLAESRPGPLPWGIVPFSPSTRGEALLEAHFEMGGAERDVARVRVAAIARATGIPSVALGQRILLGGGGFRVLSRPRDSTAEPMAAPPGQTFLPDRPGRYQLADASGREISLRAGRHDETPLDCGRSECHASEAQGAARSPMTSVLQRGIDGDLGSYAIGCALRCHAAGEPGIADGGFATVAHELALPIGDRVAGGWVALPRALRRLGGVGCSACHGPGAIPERDARWAILRADVCAVCHDAPPRYEQVAAWRSTRMARSDEDPRTRAGDCAGCHTTAGFLARIEARPEREHGMPPADAGTIGIACAACHAPHGRDVGTALVRRVVPPPELGAAAATIASAPSGVCLPCHTAQAAIWLGVGGVDVTSGAPLPAEAPHRGTHCTGCHAPHAFAASRDPAAARDATSIAERAAALRARAELPEGLPHASPPLPPARQEELERARQDLRLLLEDPGAAFHNAGHARRLLDQAEAVIGPAP